MSNALDELETDVANIKIVSTVLIKPNARLSSILGKWHPKPESQLVSSGAAVLKRKEVCLIPHH